MLCIGKEKLWTVDHHTQNLVKSYSHVLKLVAIFFFDGKPEFWIVNKDVFKNGAEWLLLSFLFPWSLKCLLSILLHINLQSHHHFQTPSHTQELGVPFCGVFKAQVAGITHLN